MSDSLTERLRAAAIEAIYDAGECSKNLREDHITSICEDCSQIMADAAVAAYNRALVDAGSEEVLEAANTVACERYADLYGSMPGDDVMRECLRAARPLLVAAERALVAGLSHTLGEVEAERATLRQEHERVREELAAELEEERSWSCDGCGTGFSRPSKEPCPVCTLRQRLAEVTDLMRRVDAALNLGGWYESAIVEHGSSWHLSLDEHLIFEQATMDLDDFLAAAPQAPEGV